ncbi:MAG: chromate transporter [Lachnospira sp.]
MKELIDLYLTFARIGGFTFGGGYAMLPMLQKEVVDARHWATEDEIMDYYAIGQCTPGIIAVNTATFVGYKVKGIAGGIFATLGLVSPSIVIITIIAAFLKNFAQYAVVKNAFAGIRICVVVLIIQAVIKLGKKSVKDLWTALIFSLVVILGMFTPIATYLYVLGAGVLGILFSQLKKVTSREKAENMEKSKKEEK